VDRPYSQFNKSDLVNCFKETLFYVQQSLACFNSDLPNRGRAEENCVPSVLDRSARRRRELPGCMESPKQCMRIEQECRTPSLYSERPEFGSRDDSLNSSSKLTSTSQQPGFSLTLPRSRPNLRGLPEDPNGVSRTIGRPAFARMISSPATASSTNRDK
jgi:hypothetical protein